ncbi:MAG TPA: hypothetical protein VL633_05205 [Bacteroidota bacterium]|jgi:hypothetical protein|nr:hypothetical protein [Bacteroidota bacterium]
MKYIKYDEDGKQVSSKETEITDKDLPKSNIDMQLNLVDNVARKRTIRGAVIGVVVGIPIGAFFEIIRFLGGYEWDNFFWGTVVFLTVLILSTAIGYVSGSMADRD